VGIEIAAAAEAGKQFAYSMAGASPGIGIPFGLLLDLKNSPDHPWMIPLHYVEYSEYCSEIPYLDSPAGRFCDPYNDRGFTVKGRLPGPNGTEERLQGNGDILVYAVIVSMQCRCASDDDHTDGFFCPADLSLSAPTKMYRWQCEEKGSQRIHIITKKLHR